MFSVGVDTDAYYYILFLKNWSGMSSVDSTKDRELSLFISVLFEEDS